MKTQKAITVFLLVISVLFMLAKDVKSQFTMTQKLFDPNNASTYFQNTGIFNQNIAVQNMPGFMWPKGSNKYAIFTTGLTIAALVNDSLRMAAASYIGEYRPGYTTNRIPYTDTNFHIYKVKRGDNAINNPDYANWGTMVPFGAPYNDVNNNGQFDPGIDIPGVKNAEQTIFIALTDGFAESHSVSEGFGGGTPSLYADLRITAWGYSIIPGLEDVHFIKFLIINKNNLPWTHTFMGLVTDPDLGGTEDDYIGCDSARKLGYCYNFNNNDPQYGTAPPAVGFLLLKGAENHSIVPNIQIGLTSVNFFVNAGYAPPPCESDPYSEPFGAYSFLKGFKKDGSPFLNPTTTPYTPTKFVYNSWSESQGSIQNCGGISGVRINVNPPGDRRLLMGMGAENFTMAPNDTQTIVVSQLIARGSSNLNSVTQLKSLSDAVRNIYNNGFNLFYSVSGNVKYLDNNQNVTTGSVKAFRLNTGTGQIMVLDSTGILPDGSYQLNNVPQGDNYIGAVPNSTTQTDYVFTYYPSSIYYQNATLLNINGNQTGINVRVFRKTISAGTNTVNGKVTINIAPYTAIKDANVYALSGSTFVGYAVSGTNGMYSLANIPNGNLKVFVNRIGYSSDSIMLNISKSTLDSVNFRLAQLYVSVNQVSSEVPDKYLLYQNYPNPFNPNTIIKFQIKESKFTTLKVYNILGKQVATLVNGKLNAGIYEVPFNGSALASGVYFYRLITGNYTETKRMVLFK
ncbi:MAG: T9SS type A sorting domain-containing protein [Ignavibacteriae bacterium]|nr:T9SS type A sorting domain-containing protein [Ignavibacteriota bacterium]